MKPTHLIASSAAIFASVIIFGALAVYKVEQFASNANITTIGDALWWAVNICSVGDAHLYPVTCYGRIIGTLLIIIGYSCFALNVGIVSAFINHIIKHK